MTVTESMSVSGLLAHHQLVAPESTHEDWLYYPLNECLSSNYTAVKSVHRTHSNDGFFMQFSNGQLVDSSLPESVQLSTTSIVPRDTKNAFIHAALLTATHYELSGACESPISIIYDASPGALSVHVLRIVGASIRVARQFSAPKSSCILSYTQVDVAANGSIIMSDTNHDNHGYVLDFVDADLVAGSQFFSLNQSYLSACSRFQNRVYIHGEQATATLHGLAINQSKQSCFYNTHIVHDTEASESHQLFKSMVKQDATLAYNGKVSVRPHAQKTNSYQLNQNIILDDYANVYSRPQLFIDADDVRCTHGSTTGDINAHEVFYLMSRGLDYLTSRKIVLNAFFEPVFDCDAFKSEQQDVHAILNKIL